MEVIPQKSNMGGQTAVHQKISNFSACKVEATNTKLGLRSSNAINCIEYVVTGTDMEFDSFDLKIGNTWFSLET